MRRHPPRPFAPVAHLGLVRLAPSFNFICRPFRPARRSQKTMREERAHSETAKHGRNAARWWVGALGCSASLGVCVAVGLRAWDIGVPGEWTWPYFEDATDWVWGAASAVPFAGLLGIVFYAGRRGLANRSEEAGAVGAVFLLALLSFYTMPLVDPSFPHRAEMVTAFPWAGGYYTEALFVERPGPYLRRYPALIGALSVKGPLGHIANHPPAPVLLHWWLNRAVARSEWLRGKVLPEGSEALPQLAHFVQTWTVAAYEDRPAVPSAPVAPPRIAEAELAGLFLSTHAYKLLAALASVGAYFLGRELGGAQAAVPAAALTALVPSIHAFSPFLDQAFLPISVVCLLCAALALRRRNFWVAAAGGAALFVGMQFTFAFLVVGAVGFTYGAICAWAAWRTAPEAFRWKPWLSLLGGAVLGFLAPWALLHAFFGYDSWEVWRICYAQHAGFSELFGRSYWPWLLMGPVDFAVFLGPPVLALLGWLAWRDIRERCESDWQPTALLCSLAFVLAFLALSGKNRGEVGRLWMIVMPLATPLAAIALRRLEPKPAALTVAVFVAMFAQTLVIRGSLEVLRIG